MSLVAVVPAVAPPLPATPAAANPVPAAAGPAERPDLIAAQLAARTQARRIEVTGARTESTSTFVNPDGSITVSSYSGVIRVARGAGWVPVDTTLVRAGDRVVPKAAKAHLTFSGGGAGSELAALDEAGRHLGFGWAGRLPAPELAGDTATYPGVLPGADLLVQARPTGFEVSVRLSRPPTSARALAAALRLPLRLSGLSASRSGGGLRLTSSAGAVVARSPQPTMFDAHRDAATGLPDRVRPVAADLAPAAGGATLSLSPDLAWLTDPGRVYPVTIDPAAQLADNLDTVVNSVNATANLDTFSELWAGNFQSAVNRSFLRFNDAAIKGKHVTSATLQLWQAGSATCTPKPMVVQGATGMGPGTTWNTQPAADGHNWSNTTFNNGGSCTGTGATALDVTGLVDAWAHNGFPSPEVLTLRVPNESDPSQFKRFYSGDTILAPHIDTTYNSYPGTVAGRFTSPCSAQCGGSPAMVLTNSTTPTLRGGTGEADGNRMTVFFEVWNAAGTALVASGSVADLPPGGLANWTVPVSLSNGTAYQWRSRAFDGLDYSRSWSSWIPFTVDTAAPGAPAAVATAQWPSGGWTPATAGTFSWVSPGGDTAAFLYGVDQPSPTTETTATSTPTLTVGAGQHTFRVRAVDRAGNLSPVVSYVFGAGNAALRTPVDQDRTQGSITLQAAGPPGQTAATYRYRLGADPATPWTDVPTADTTVPGTTTHPTWPVSGTGGVFGKLTWNLAGTVAAAGGTDGPVQVQACLTGGTAACSPAATVQFARHAFGASYATREVGPGAVSLLTGDYSVTATDASLPDPHGDLDLGRTFTTLAPAGAGIFGPGWTATVPGADLTLSDHPAGSYVTLARGDGGQSVYVRTGTGGFPYHYTGLADAGADGSTLTRDSAGQFTLTDGGGRQTVWVGTQTGWVVSRVVAPGSEGTTTYSTDAQGRLTRILPPAPAGVSCTAALVAGCRALDLGYPARTTATGSDPLTWGDYAGQVAQITMALNGHPPVVVARYLYDATGHLRRSWDPRLDSGPNHLAVSYGYDGAGRLSSLAPPGVSAWTLGYDGAGRLRTVSRPDPSGSTAVQTIAYDIPFTGAGAPLDLSAAQVASWNQQDLPVAAAAVFPASHVPAAPPTAADWPYADLTYLDVNGRKVNTASYGAGAWQVATTEYDSAGKVVRTLSAANRAQALAPTADTDPTVASLADPATRARLLDDQTVYDGVDVIDTLGPTRPVVLDDGTNASARTHVRNFYDQGAPQTGGPYRLLTRTDTSQYVNGADVGEPRSTRYSYEPRTAGDTATSGWTLRQPTRTTTAGPDIQRVTYYDTAGRAVEERMPKATGGGDAHTTLTAYYTATGSGGCVNASWAGLVCTTAPAAQPGTGSPLPTTRYTYDDLGHPVTTVETVGATTRTHTTGYDPAGRKVSESLAVTPAAAGGTAVPDRTYTYDPATGQQATVTSAGISLSTTFDALGRPRTRTDADGNTATFGYTLDGLLASVSDGRGSTSYGYDGTDSAGRAERRGLLTTLVTGTGGAPGTFTAGYDPDGNLQSQTYPNGLVATTRYDNAGSAASLTYAKGGTAWLAFTRTGSAYGQTRTSTSPGATRSSSYDPAGRLSAVTDTQFGSGSGSCTTRRYGYDADSNRTSLTSYPDAGTDPANGACATATTPTVSPYAYDEADRTVGDGTGHDVFGRITSVPAKDAGGTAMAVGYYANGMVASQTRGPVTRTYILDPDLRIRNWTQAGVTSTNHYTGDGDSPAWTGVSDGTWTRNIAGIDGDLAAIQSSDGTVTLQLPNLHGDIVATAADTAAAASIAGYTDTDEFGVPYPAAPANPRYGWLGAKQRSGDTPGGLLLMGARLYNPVTGRFLQTDPIAGGSANDYDYVDQGPLDNYDLDGTCFPCFHIPGVNRYTRAGAAWVSRQVHRIYRWVCTNKWVLRFVWIISYGGRYVKWLAVPVMVRTTACGFRLW